MSDKSHTEEIEEVSDSELEIEEEDFKPKPKKKFVMTDSRRATLEKGRLKRLDNISYSVRKRGITTPKGRIVS